eukprot:COSAG02_NODE_21713_length_777_cov_2.109145_2_plen_128_part_01
MLCARWHDDIGMAAASVATRLGVRAIVWSPVLRADGLRDELVLRQHRQNMGLGTGRCTKQRPLRELLGPISISQQVVQRPRRRLLLGGFPQAVLRRVLGRDFTPALRLRRPSASASSRSCFQPSTSSI